MSSASTSIAGAILSVERSRLLTDEEAFSQVYARTHLIVFRYIYGLHGGPQQEVEDLTAETFLRAWKARKHFEGDRDDALRWLLQIARNLVIDSHRRRGRRGIPANIEKLILTADVHSPEERAVLNEQHIVLDKMLQTLSDKRREMLVLRYMLGWKVKNIGRHMGIRPNTVSVNIRRALHELRENWPEQNFPVNVPQNDGKGQR